MGKYALGTFYQYRFDALNFEGCAIVPDAWGAIFSGSCVVDHNNTAGFGKGAVVAFYTSAKATPWGDVQSQSMAYSFWIMEKLSPNMKVTLS